MRSSERVRVRTNDASIVLFFPEPSLYIIFCVGNITNDDDDAIVISYSTWHVPINSRCLRFSTSTYTRTLVVTTRRVSDIYEYDSGLLPDSIIYEIYFMLVYIYIYIYCSGMIEFHDFFIFVQLQ
jgi:hypothetical protein